MNRRPLVSVIINNFNYARYVAEAIDSALAQSYRSTEVIVVDDGSTDESREVIARYGARVTMIFKENGGQASACNAGFDASRGDVICFLDADDTMLPTAVERAVPLFNGEGVVKVHWPLHAVSQSGESSGAVIPAADLAEGDLRDDVIRRGPLRYVTSPTSGNAWSRQYLQRVYPIHEWGNKHGSDAYLSILAPLYGRVARVAEPQGTYRVHAENFSGNSKRRQRAPELFEAHSILLAQRLAAIGIQADVAGWKKDHYAWEQDVADAAQAVAEIVPTSSRFILIDDGQLGEALAPGRRAVPFLERNGEYWGPPPDDQTAIRELHRLRNGGVGFVVFAWPAFWWAQQYPDFHRHLRSTFPCVLENNRVAVFDIRQRVTAEGGSR